MNQEIQDFKILPYYMYLPAEKMNRIGRRLKAKYLRTKEKVVTYSKRVNCKKRKLISYETRG